MITDRAHRRGVLWSVLIGLCVTPILLFYGVTIGWSCLTGLGSALVLGWLRHSRPGLFDGNAGTMDPKLVARQETVKARLAAGWAGSG